MMQQAPSSNNFENGNGILKGNIKNSDLYELYNSVIGKALSKVRGFIREQSGESGTNKLYNKHYREFNKAYQNGEAVQWFEEMHKVVDKKKNEIRLYKHNSLNYEILRRLSTESDRAFLESVVVENYKDYKV